MKFLPAVWLVLLPALLWGCQPSTAVSLPAPVAVAEVGATAVPPTPIPSHPRPPNRRRPCQRPF
ncbi:MAG: hypothetical protein P8183_12560, partial [Anaerolineae bacterium]